MQDQLPKAQQNPFSTSNPDRAAIWTMLVSRDIDAFVSADWSMVADDFIGDAFIGIDAKKQTNPDNWDLAFPNLQLYRDEWLRQAQEFQTTEFVGDARAAIFNATRLEEIEINGDRAIARKKFDGEIPKADGTVDRLLWQTLYYCQKHNGAWKLTGFTGYLPNPMGQDA